jgi:hypothetical protein
MRSKASINGLTQSTLHLKENNVKKHATATLALFAAVVIPAVPRVYAAQFLDGVISDSMCGRKHMIAGKTPAQCVAECIRNNSRYVLVTKDKIYTLEGKPQAVAPFSGKHVLIDGTLKGNTVTVASIHEVKAGIPAGMPM